MSLSTDVGAPSDGSGERRPVFIADEGGSRAQVMHGDITRVCDTDGCGQQRMRVVRVHAKLGLIEANAGGNAVERNVSPERVMLVYEGVTLARQQLRNVLAMYLALCTAEDCRPHEGLVEAIERSVAQAHAGHADGKMCLDLSRRQLGDDELIALNTALNRWHAANESPADGESSAVNPRALLSEVKVVDVSHNCIGSDGASSLGAIISREAPLIEELYLDSNRISDGIQRMTSGESCRCCTRQEGVAQRDEEQTSSIVSARASASGECELQLPECVAMLPVS